MQKDKVNTIKARGFVVADYDTAKFTLSFNEYALKAKDAKTKLKAGVAKVSAAIESLRGKGLELLKSSFHTSTSVSPHLRYDSVSRLNVKEGQIATYSVTFQTPTLDLVSEAYDVLSELEVNECTINSPTFLVRAESALKQQALEDAWKVAQVLMTNQCRVLGLDEKNFTVAGWDVNYSGDEYYGGKGRNFTNSVASGGAGLDDDAIELVSGKALVAVVLTVDYARKAL